MNAAQLYRNAEAHSTSLAQSRRPDYQPGARVELRERTTTQRNGVVTYYDGKHDPAYPAVRWETGWRPSPRPEDLRHQTAEEASLPEPQLWQADAPAGTLYRPHASDPRPTRADLSRSTQTPPRRTAAKEVTIHEDAYEASHHRAPRGYGDWKFAPTHAYNGTTRAGKPIVSPADRTANPITSQRQEDTYLHQQTIEIQRATYAQARRAAAKLYASQGTTDITVLP